MTRKYFVPALMLIYLCMATSAYANTDTASNISAAFSSVKIQGDGQVISVGATGSIITTTSLTTPTTLPTSPATAVQHQDKTIKHEFPKKRSAIIPRMQDNEQLQSAPPVGVVPEATASAFKKNEVGRVAVKGERIENPAISNRDKPTKTGANLTPYFLTALFLLATVITLAKAKRAKRVSR